MVVTTAAISRAKLQSNHHQQTTKKSSFLQVGCPSGRPTNSVRALKRKVSHYPKLSQAPTLSLTIKGSWLPWGRFAKPQVNPLMPVTNSRICLENPQ